LYFELCFSLVSILFSSFVFLKFNIKSLHFMKYVLVLFLAAAIPIEVANCVFSSLLESKKKMFSFLSIKRNVSYSNICSLLMNGYFQHHMNLRKRCFLFDQ